jgi:prepilin-type N-terminal cleavage/methylation domain-containing protein
MKKNGFTLVELLAVIAILAILVIIALPNVMNMFNSAKESTFTTELKKVYRGAQEQYITDAFSTSGTITYSKCSSGCTNPLKMDIRDDLEYYIQINSEGKVIKFYAKDKAFQFSHDGDLLLTQIEGVKKIADLNENEILDIGNIKAPINGDVFISYNGTVKIGEALPSEAQIYNSADEALDASGYSRRMFLKYVVNNNIVTAAYVGFKKDDEIYYLRGGSTDYYESNVNLGLSLMGSCSTSSYDGITQRICSKDKINLYIRDNGSVEVFDTRSGCYIGCRVNADGTASCDPSDIMC